jgi:hypothetical protein
MGLLGKAADDKKNKVACSSVVVAYFDFIMGVSVAVRCVLFGRYETVIIDYITILQEIASINLLACSQVTTCYTFEFEVDHNLYKRSLHNL